MTEEANLLKNEFNRIKQLGWIKTHRKGPTGIGKTFEDLLGKEEDTFSYPDFCGFEIKTKRYNTNQPFRLFSLEPDGEGMLESERLLLKFGYPSKQLPQFNILNCSIRAQKFTQVGDFMFSISVNYHLEKIFLIIQDKKGNIIDSNTYWSFNLLQECVERKLKNLAIIKAYSKFISNEEYFKYDRFKFFKNVNFKQFLRLIEQGKIIITLNIGVFSGEYRFGQPHNHGTGFNIYEDSIKYLYKNPCVVGC